MSSEPIEDIDQTIDDLEGQARALLRRLKTTYAALEHLRAMRDGDYLSNRDRREIRDLDHMYNSRAKAERYRNPPRPF